MSAAIYYTAATELVARIHATEISSVAVLQAHMHRLDALIPTLLPAKYNTTRLSSRPFQRSAHRCSNRPSVMRTRRCGERGEPYHGF
jgi:hypothetical protein